MGAIDHVRIVGTGLIGTSIGLALAQQGVSLSLYDKDESALNLASDLLRESLSNEKPDLVVIATPPQSVLSALKNEFERNPKSCFIDITSVKNNLLLEVEGLTEIAQRFVGTHPMAGRERTGASSAQADLFQGRAWVVCPNQHTKPEVREIVVGLIELLGATPYVMNAKQHDELMAQISHTPQVLSTILAGSLLQMSPELASGIELSGQGLRDMTRIAGSDGALWAQILTENSSSVSDFLLDFERELENFRLALVGGDIKTIMDFFNKGNSGQLKISGKHGAKPRNYTHLLIVIKDEPGALSELFNECAKLNANIEDLSIEHSPGQLTGLITLAFSPEDAQIVKNHLIAKDWKVHQR